MDTMFPTIPTRQLDARARAAGNPRAPREHSSRGGGAAIRYRIVVALLCLWTGVLTGRPATAATTIVECSLEVAAGSSSCSATWSQSGTVQFGSHLATHVPWGTTFASASMSWTDEDGTLVYRLTCESVYWLYDFTVESEAVPPSAECVEQNRGNFRPGLQTLTVSVSDPVCGLDACAFHGRLYECSAGASTRVQCRS